jgi:DNA uptake protein ComE-like DNA-binding protein|tara:strand:+ start:45731 stop:46183 length:453 start_codon:yes stop_codon:yes gene_type:complete
MSTKIYGPSGIKVTVLSIHDEGEYMMVQSDTSGKVFYAHKDQIQELVAVEGGSDEGPARTRRNRRKVTSTKKEPIVVKPQVPTDNRVNLNTLTAEGLTQVLPGVGIKTAKEIIELKMGLPGERFSKLDQLKAVKRIDWDEVFSTGEVYVE